MALIRCSFPMRQRPDGASRAVQPQVTPDGRPRRKAMPLAAGLALAAVLLAGRGYADSLVSCGFEPAGDIWSYTAAGGGIMNGNTGAADFPANQRILSGSGSWLVSNTTSVLTYSEVLLAGWSNVTIRYHVSSTAATSGGGATPGDSVAAYVATTTYANQAKAVFGSTADIALTGWGSGATWGYQSDTPPQVKPAGWGQTLHPAGSGLRTTDGYTDFAVSVPSGKRSLALKLYLQNDSAGKRWNLDDVAVEGSPTTSNDRWWDGDGGGTVGGGSGGWDNAASRWASAANGNSYSAWQSANGDNAHFTQAGGTVTIAAGALVAARSLTFAADGYTIAGGDSASKLALTNGGSGGPGPNTIEVTNPGQTATVNATIVGNPGVGVTKTGPGTLVLGGINAFTGPLNVQQGTLRLGSAGALVGCSAIDIAAGATLDLTAVAGGYRLGTTGSQTLQGTGSILGNLWIDPLGVHHVGHSPGVQCVQGDYVMNGLLEVEISGGSPGAGDVGYDQVLLSGTTHNVSLGGALGLAWSGAGWSSPDDRLWIVRNDTDGTLSGAFTGYANGGLVGSYDGRQWRIYYGADAASGQLTGGNDVLLAAGPVPEPSGLALLAVPTALLLSRLSPARGWHAPRGRGRLASCGATPPTPFQGVPPKCDNFVLSCALKETGHVKESCDSRHRGRRGPAGRRRGGLDLWVDYSRAQNSLTKSRLYVRDVQENIGRHPEDVGRLRELYQDAKCEVNSLEQFHRTWVGQDEIARLRGDLEKSKAAIDQLAGAANK